MTQNALNNQTVNADFTANTTTVGATGSTSVVHSDNTNTASNARVRAEVGGTAGGDPFVEIIVSGGEHYALGIDNSATGDPLVVTYNAGAVTPSSGTLFSSFNPAGIPALGYATTYDVLSQLESCTFSAAGPHPTNSGLVMGLYIQNTNSASATADAGFQAATTTSSGGSPYINFSVLGGGTSWGFGAANPVAGDPLRITWDGAFFATPTSGNLYWNMTAAGVRTMPSQTAFFARLGTTDSNVTGAGTGYNLGQGNALTVTQQGTSMATNGIFTAPVTGFYQFKTSIIVDQLTAAMTQLDAGFFLNGATVLFGLSQSGFVQANTSSAYVATWSADAFLTAGDTIRARIVVTNGVGNTADIRGGALGNSSVFSGCLVY